MSKFSSNLCTSSKLLRASVFCVLAAALIITILAYATRVFEESSNSPTPTTSADLGVFEVSSVDPDVLKAAEYLRKSYDSQRSKNCPSSVDTYNEPGIVQYAKRAPGSNGTILYIFEASFGSKSIFARVRFISNIVLKSSDAAEFEIMSSAPSPCEKNETDQLAVSALAVEKINGQNLTWTAAHYHRFQGMQVKDVGISLTRISMEERQASVLALMTAKAAPNYAADFGPDFGETSALLTDDALYTTEPAAAPESSYVVTDPTPTPEPAANTAGGRRLLLSTAQRRIEVPLPRPVLSSTPAVPPTSTRVTSPSATTPAQSASSGAQKSTPSQPTPRASTSSAAWPVTTSPATAPATTAPPAYTPPAAFDARDVYPGQEACKAFDSPDQGACNSCYAFAVSMSFSARLCRAQAGSAGNVMVATQQLMDCTSGCAGGSELDVLSALLQRPAVEDWCDPYTQAQKTCGSTCGASNAFSGVPGSVRLIGGPSEHGVLQMQLELIRGGPGVVAFMAMNDIFGYSSGVYTPSASAVLVGSHAVSLVGWGVDNGVPYWLCQNAWGAWWGERGYIRIARGPHTSSVENFGLLVVKPLPPTPCPNANCAAGSTTLKDCTCKCPPGRSGPTCAVCGLTCLNGGVRDAGCLKCSCPPGFWGARCQAGYTVGSVAACAQDAPGAVRISYSFPDGSILPPTKTSFVGLYHLDETNPFKTSLTGQVCGPGRYNQSVNGGLCPASGDFTVPRPTTPGRYKIVVAPFSPPNELGISGFYPLSDYNVIGYYTLLPAGCSASDRAAANYANAPSTILSAALNASAAASATQQASMAARLASVKPVAAALLAEPPAALSVVGANTSEPLVWLGMPGGICFRVPPSANVANKVLTLYVGDGSSGIFYPTALGASGRLLPAAAQGCVNFTISRGLPVGRYTLALEDSATGFTFAALSLVIDKAVLNVGGFGMIGPVLIPTLVWNIPAGRATANDTLRVADPAGATVAWIYLNSKGATVPGPLPAPMGSYPGFRLRKGPLRGGYTFELRVGGVLAAVAPNLLPWAALGW